MPVRLRFVDPERIQPYMPGVPRHAILEAMRSAVVMNYRPGETIVGAGEQSSPSLIIEGTARLNIVSNRGRQATLRLIRPGAMFGISSLFRTRPQPPWFEVSLSAAERSTVIAFNPTAIAKLCRNHCDFAMHLVESLVDWANALADTSGRFALMTVRQRVAAHLLELIQSHTEDDTLPSVATTQQQLADAVGSVRDVVARILSQFRAEGLLVRGSRAHVTILDSVRLADAALGTT